MKKERYPYISKSKYLKLLNKIRNNAKELGVNITIYNRPIIWRRFGIYPNFGEHRGYYINNKKRIIVTFYGRIGHGKKLFLLLHELRHAIHHNKGLYKDYYNPLWDDLEKLFEMENPPMPCKRTAFLAELDCNRFAYHWLKKEGIKIPKDLRYSPLNTVAYQIHKMYQDHLKNL